MKEITPFIYSALFTPLRISNAQMRASLSFNSTHEVGVLNEQRCKKRFDTFEQYQNVFSPWIICSNLAKKTVPEPEQNPIEYVIEEIHLPPPEPKPTPITTPIKIEEPIPIKAKEPIHISTSSKYNLYDVRKPDSLFWSIFIGKYGLAEYFTITHGLMNREIEEKKKMIMFMQSFAKNHKIEGKQLLKHFRITIKDLNAIMGDLMQNKTTNLSTIPIFVTYYKQSIWVIHEGTNSYLKYEWESQEDEDDQSKSPILIFKRGNKYSVPKDDSVKFNITDAIQIEKPDCVMKSISTFKMTDLTKMANILSVHGNQIDLHQKKQDLYTSIYRLLDSAWLSNK